MTKSERYGRAVKAARSAKGLTQAQLAGKCGVNQPAISNIEHGRSDPSEKLKARLAKLLGVAS